MGKRKNTVMDRLNDSTYQVSKDDFQLKVGDDKQTTFYPQLKSEHWGNEVNFSARLVDDFTGTYSEKDGTVTYINGQKEVRFYEKHTGDEYGGFEFDIIFNSKPVSNIVRFTLQHKGLDCFYQPELTDKEKENGFKRPDNVIGSYAFYHSTQKHNKYKTGKAFHIYRPWAIDSNNTQVWCDLNITGSDMTITVPQSFIDNAVYPILIDPTFGYTSVGASATNFGTGPDGCKFTAPEGGLTYKITCSIVQNFGGFDIPFQAGLYTDSGGNPTTKLGNSSSVLITDTGATAWYDFPMVTNFAAGDLWPFVWTSDAATSDFRYDSGAANQFAEISAGAPFAWDATAGTPAFNNLLMSIYVTYKVSTLFIRQGIRPALFKPGNAR